MNGSKDPYQLLKDLNLHEQNHNRGKLKIFFGYAAGVGKTYAMLEAAHEIKKEGYDVIIGYIEPHQRPETNALLAGLEVIPALVVRNRGINTLEFDLDAALQRKPDIILVDELAHTNANGLRHKKRFQDVEELLDHGIDVYSTINVQHIESLNDKVASITHVNVTERIPDKIFDQADQVEVIDIEVDELIERLKKGKIYQKEKVDTALTHFFNRENLVALREISLRRTADRINQKIDCNLNYISGEHILVCISASPSNAKVIRAAARMANVFHGKLTALYVEGSDIMDKSDATKEILRNHFRLAQSFNAEIAIVNGTDLPTQIVEFAKISGVSKIIIGRTKRKSNVFGYKLGFVDQLISLAPEIEIYVIPDAEHNVIQSTQKFQFQKSEIMYLCILLGCCTLAAYMFYQSSHNTVSVVLCYVIGSVLLATRTHEKSYAMIYSVLSVILFNYFFIEPLYLLKINEKSYLLTFILLMSVTLLINKSTSVSAERAKRAAKEAYLANSLLRMASVLQKDDVALIDQVIAFFKQTFQMSIAYYEKAGEKVILHTEEKDAFLFNSREDAVVKWVLNNRKRAGKTTDTLPAANALYIPIIDQDKVYGCIAFAASKEQLNEINEIVLIAMLNQFTLKLAKDNK